MQRRLCRIARETNRLVAPGGGWPTCVGTWGCWQPRYITVAHPHTCEAGNIDVCRGMIVEYRSRGVVSCGSFPLGLELFAFEYDAEGTLCSDSGRFAMCSRCCACCGALLLLGACCLELLGLLRCLLMSGTAWAPRARYARQGSTDGAARRPRPPMINWV